ncbi:MAG: ankyrin repeat domain-containing protein [Spirochaetia bacterium]|nr:ankyrin repeat domain-containing protein [Spirochaetia bacterium]
MKPEDQLIESINNSDASGVRAALESGADVNYMNMDDGGMTPMNYACVAKSGEEIVRILIDRGADVKRTDSFGMSPLHYAAASANLKVVQMLVENGANINAKVGLGATPLFYAASENNLHILKYLLDLGCDINSKMKNGWTPLDWAKDNNDQVAIEFIRANSAKEGLIDKIKNLFR